MTAQDLINRACRLLGAVNAAVNDAALAADMLAGLSDMIDSLNLDRNQIFTVQPAQYVWPSGVVSQTIGPGGNFNGPRPIKITEANLLYQTSPLYKIVLKLLNADEYAAITMPSIASVPRQLYYDKGYSSSAPTGLGTLYSWPVPNGSYTFEFWCWLALTAPPLLTTTLVFPPGYQRMLAFELAREFAPEIGRPWATDLEMLRLEARYRVEANNAPSPLLRSDPALPGTTGRSNFNYLTGEPY